VSCNIIYTIQVWYSDIPCQSFPLQVWWFSGLVQFEPQFSVSKQSTELEPNHPQTIPKPNQWFGSIWYGSGPVHSLNRFTSEPWHPYQCTPMGMPDNTPGQEQSLPLEDCVAFQALYSHPCQLSQQLQGRDQGVLLLEIQDTMSLFRFWPDAKALGYQFNW